ncbi:MAG: DUF2017 family protein [Microthrixaceae bacterium]
MTGNRGTGPTVVETGEPGGEPLFVLVPDDDERDRLLRWCEGAARGDDAPLAVRLASPAGPDGLIDDGVVTGADLAEALRDLLGAVATAVESSHPRPVTAGAIERLPYRCAGIVAFWYHAVERRDGRDPDPERLDEATVEALDVLVRLAEDCDLMLWSRFIARPDRVVRIRWRRGDAEGVTAALAAVDAVLETDDPAVTRLFPTAYGDDRDRNAGWDALQRGELIDARRASITIARDLLGRRSCTLDELAAFSRAINDARLVIGTRLDVTEDPEPRRDGRLTGRDGKDLSHYEWLGLLLEEVVRTLDRGL